MGHDVVIVTGGIGLAPLRPLIDGLLAQRDRFERDPPLLRRPDPGRPAVPRGAPRRGPPAATSTCSSSWTARAPDWTGPVGVVTHLFDQATWDGERSLAFVCGPERMMEATVRDARGPRALARTGSS